MRRFEFFCLLLLGVCALGSLRVQGDAPFRFAVSGDSRDCGDVVMPALAAQVVASHPAFYWHLGDYRKIYDFDPDMQHQPDHLKHPMNIEAYETGSWEDFIDNQLAPFGTLPVFLTIGNHETVPPKARPEYLAQFADWLDTPLLRQQRLQDDAHAHMLQTWYHWIEDGIDFISLDNATPDQFDEEQLKWFEGVLARDAARADIRTLVVGMHEALPDSISDDHSMSQSETGRASGRHLYQDLLRMQNESHKHVYVLASHAHYYMENIFDTDYCRTHGGVLPGWIIGTAGAPRYTLPTLPPNHTGAAVTKVYGYLMATHHPDGTLQFDFHLLNESDVPPAVVARYGQDFVHWCFTENAPPPHKFF